ncbi:MAG TPA: cytochrome o ubiquinol oxidase subunit I [Candidatus Saccharimonadales bacterium]|nr:cytochrome o ubiquinol oxidase subunit I [Candidatus Saccharimonadales bacterium]
MTMFAFALLGRLNWNQLPHDAITRGGAASIVLGALLVVGLITYLKRWKWLWKEWLTTQDPKKIGVMYIIVALVMLLRGAGDALLMRTQQAVSVGNNHGILDSYHFQQIFSAHGTIMIFFVAMGLMFGLINLVLPLQIGARDVAFPFLNATSFWLFFSGMALVNLSLVIGDFSAAGWLAYPPLSELKFSPTVGVDYWIWALQIAGVGSLLSGINFLVTVIKMRAPGMTFKRLPLFTWSVMASMVLVAFAFPILTVTLALLALDRTLGMHFFTAGMGGNAMMYVNLIWAWGHPEVYILVLPAFGVYSEIVATFARKKLFGYTSMVWAIWAIVLLSFTVWLHHFFTMGAGANVNAFFGITTGIIAIPTGVKIFNWLFTMYRGRIKFASPMLWFMGFVVVFTIGGVAGVMMSVPAIDYQVHNSLFLVAHFHMMIVGGVVFGYFAGLTYWFPKIFGFRLHEGLGKLAFWFWSGGFVVAFTPLYILGLMGATRRLDHYDASLGWQPLFIVAGIGVILVGVGVGFQILQLAVSIYQRNQRRDLTGDPWNGRTLEWSVPSPAPFYNFTSLPVVAERDQFWADKQTGKKATHYEDILLPKNSGLSVVIAGFAFLIGFGMVWHIYWLSALALLGLITTLVVRASNPEPEYILSAREVEKHHNALVRRQKELAA